MLRYPTVRKVNLRTQQFRRRGVLILGLSQTITQREKSPARDDAS